MSQDKENPGASEGLDEMIDDLDAELDDETLDGSQNEPDGNDSEAGDEVVEGEDEDEDEAENEDDGSSEIESLKLQVARLEGLLQAQQQGQDQDDGNSEEEVDATKINFMTEEEAVSILEEGNAQKLNEVLVRTVQAAAQLSHQQALRTLPPIVQQAIQSETQRTQAAQMFYDKNPDLEEFRPYVRTVAQELHKANPSWDTAKLFKEVPKEVRRRLKLAAPKKDAGKKKPKPAPGPAGGKRGGSAKPQPKKDDFKSKQQEAIDDLL